MSLDGSAWSNDLYGKLSALGFTGSRMLEFCQAVGNGSVAHVVGKPFTTTDLGSGSGPTPGIGTGIVGLIESAISNAIYNEAVSLFGSSGSKLKDLCDAIAQACISQMGIATLTTSSTLALGTGTVNIGSIGVVGTAWASLIQSNSSFAGSQWPNFCTAIGNGQANQIIATGTGTVIIGPGGSGATPGSGVGVLS